MNRDEWKLRMETWWLNHCEENRIVATKDNPNAVAIGCHLDPNAKIADDPERRYYVVIEPEKEE